MVGGSARINIPLMRARPPEAEMENIEAEIIRLSQLIAHAEKRKDADAVSPHLAEDYVGIDPSGEVIDKATVVGRHRSDGFNLNTLRLSDIKVRAQRDCAWEFGTMDLAGNLGDKKFGGRYRYSHFWVRMGTSWLIAASQMTPVLR
jgi:ketosteroid isomerase-like protein